MITEILAALDTQLLLTTGLPTFRAENERYLKVNKTAFCRSTILPAKTTVETLGLTGYDRISGLYQVDLFYPSDEGYTTSGTIADAIVANFPKTLQLTLTGGQVIAIEMAWRQPARKLDNHYNLPILVSWYGYK